MHRTAIFPLPLRMNGGGAGTLSGRRWQVWKKRIRPCVPRATLWRSRPAPRNDSGENKDRSEARDDEKQQTDQIVDTGSVITGDGRHMIHCLTVIGQIEGHNVLPSQNKTTKYEHVIPQLVAIEEEPRIDGLLMILNTVGGDVEAGLAIAELVAGMKKPTVSLVLGGGHSIGVPLAVAAKHSFIAPSATMTIHPVRMNGLMLGVPQTLEYFQRMQRHVLPSL